MDLKLINTELSESRLFRASRSFSTLSGKDISNLLYLNTLLTYMLAQDEKQSIDARDYAKRSSQYSTYSLFRTHATDMYLLAYQVLNPNNDHAKIRDPIDSKQHLENLSFNKRMHISFMRKIASSNDTRADAVTYFYRLESQLKITDNKYRAFRRMIPDWSKLSYSSKQRLVAQIIQELRRVGTGAGQYSELAGNLTSMLKYKKYKDVINKTDEPSTGKKLAGAALGAIAGRVAGDKINKADNKTAKNVGTGIGAIAGYWAAGRNKK